MSEIRLMGVNDTKSIDEYDTYLKCPNCSGTFQLVLKPELLSKRHQMKLLQYAPIAKRAIQKRRQPGKKPNKNLFNVIMDDALKVAAVVILLGLVALSLVLNWNWKKKNLKKN